MQTFELARPIFKSSSVYKSYSIAEVVGILSFFKIHFTNVVPSTKLKHLKASQALNIYVSLKKGGNLVSRAI